MKKVAKVNNQEGLLKIVTGDSPLVEMLRRKIKRMAENRGVEVTETFEKPREKSWKR